MTTPADWQLPPGVSRGLWDYLHDAETARRYDDRLAGTPLLSVDIAFAQQHFDRPGRLIDLGCGTGRLMLPFAQRGYWVLGVDLSAEMLKVTGAKAGAAGVEVHRLQANIVQLEGLADQSFDYAACLFSTLGMVAGNRERGRVLRQVHRLLRPEGKFVLHVHNRWFNCWDPDGRAWLLRDCWRSLRGNEYAGDKLMPAHQGITGFTLHLFTRREISSLLIAAGFRLLDVQPLSLHADGRLPWPGWFGGVRSYGYLLAARKE